MPGRVRPYSCAATIRRLRRIVRWPQRSFQRRQPSFQEHRRHFRQRQRRFRRRQPQASARLRASLVIPASLRPSAPSAVQSPLSSLSLPFRIVLGRVPPAPHSVTGVRGLPRDVLSRARCPPDPLKVVTESFQRILDRSKRLIGSDNGLLGPAEGVFGASKGLFYSPKDLFGWSQDLFGSSKDILSLSKDLFCSSKDLFCSPKDIPGSSKALRDPSRDIRTGYPDVRQAARGGEPQAQAVGGGSEPRQADAAGCPAKKNLTPDRKRTLVRQLQVSYEVSERRACRRARNAAAGASIAEIVATHASRGVRCVSWLAPGACTHDMRGVSCIAGERTSFLPALHEFDLCRRDGSASSELLWASVRPKGQIQPTNPNAARKSLNPTNVGRWKTLEGQLCGQPTRCADSDNVGACLSAGAGVLEDWPASRNAFLLWRRAGAGQAGRSSTWHAGNDWDARDSWRTGGAPG